MGEDVFYSMRQADNGVARTEGTVIGRGFENGWNLVIVESWDDRGDIDRCGNTCFAQTANRVQALLWTRSTRL